jgi:hypothetical protein
VKALIVAIELLQQECVVPRGTAEITWWVSHERGWISAHEWPGARTDQLDAGPGTIWQTRITLELAVGTTLMRVESRPRVEGRRDAMDYLSREVRSAAHQTVRTYHRVDRRGRLVRGR